MIARLMTLAKRSRALWGLKLAEIGLHVGQDEVLLALDGTLAIEVGRLADIMSVRPSTVSKMVDRLVFQGLVERTTMPQDRRKTAIRISAVGLELRSRVLVVRHEMDQCLQKALSRGEVETLERELLLADHLVAGQLMRLR